MTSPQRLLVVCTGNVCRSPYLHRRLALGLAGTGIEVESAGTGALAGHPMDERMAALLGADHDADFLARDLDRDIVLGADLVLTATRAHRTAVTRLAPKALRTTFALADFAQLADSLTDDDVAGLAGRPLAERVAVVGGQRAKVTPLAADAADVVDPFRREDAVYRESAEQIDRLVPPVLRVLR